MKKLGVISLVLLAVAGGFYFWSRHKSANGTKAGLKRGPIVEAIYGLGTVTSNREFNFKVGVTSQIRQIFVREGQEIGAGAPLLRLEDSGVQKAPFSGTVISLPFKEGETVYPQAPILTLVDLHDRYIRVSLEQQGAIRVRPGQTARLTFESLRGQKFEGKIESIFPRSDQFVAHITVRDLPKEILPGMTADVAIEVGRKPDALLLPVTALSSGRVIVERGNHPQKIEVKIGIVDGEWAEVLEGDVREGDLVFVRKEK